MRKNKLKNLSVLDNTGARIQPSIVVGQYNGFTSGEILDANAIVQMIKESKIPVQMPDNPNYHINPETGEQEETTVASLQNEIDRTQTEVELIKQQLVNIVGSAPAELDTVEELAQAITNINEYHQQPKATVDATKETLYI